MMRNVFVLHRSVSVRIENAERRRNVGGVGVQMRRRSEGRLMSGLATSAEVMLAAMMTAMVVASRADIDHAQTRFHVPLPIVLVKVHVRRPIRAVLVRHPVVGQCVTVTATAAVLLRPSVVAVLAATVSIHDLVHRLHADRELVVMILAA